MHACAVPSVLISRAQCTGTSQSFYSSEGDVNPEYVKAREQHVGLDVVGDEYGGIVVDSPQLIVEYPYPPQCPPTAQFD